MCQRHRRHGRGRGVESNHVPSACPQMVLYHLSYPPPVDREGSEPSRLGGSAYSSSLSEWPPKGPLAQNFPCRNEQDIKDQEQEEQAPEQPDISISLGHPPPLPGASS